MTSTGAAATANVGSYAVTVSNLSVGDGYATSIQPGTLTVTPAILTYVANAASRTYGGADPALGGTVTGFFNNDTLSSATTGTLNFASSDQASSAVGSYAINGSGLSATNYVFAQAAGNLGALAVVPPSASPQPPSPPPPPVESPLTLLSDPPNSSDQATSAVADSLDGANTASNILSDSSTPGSGPYDMRPSTVRGNNGQVLLPHMLAIAPPLRPVLPVDVSALSSFGNSSLWQ